VVRTDFVGFLLGEGYSMLDFTIMLLSPMITLPSFGEIFSGIRLS
jgi:hypothetical protein